MNLLVFLNKGVFRSPKTASIILMLFFGAIAWINPSSFLWRDEWTYPLYYHENNFQLFNGNFSFDVKPLFHYILYFQFNAFTNHFAYYQLLNALLLIACGLLFWKIALRFQVSLIVALVMALLYMLHPVNFVNAFWIFQQCELLHLTLLLISILSFLTYLQSPKPLLLLGYGTSLALQNFFFPNGTFYSLFFLLLLVIDHFLCKVSSERKFDLKIVLATVLVLALHLCHAFSIKSKMDPNYGLVSNLSAKVEFFFTFFVNTLLRVFIPNLKPLNFIYNVLITVVFFVMIIISWNKLDLKLKRLLTFGVLGWLSASLTLSLTRSDAKIILYYYTTLALPFSIIVLMVFVEHLKLLNKRSVRFAIFISIGVFLFLDLHGKRIFGSRNEANVEQMKIALRTRVYVPFDDPYFLPGERRLDLKPFSYQEAPVVLYEFLSKEKGK